MLDMEVEFRRGVLFVRLLGFLVNRTKDKFEKEIYNLINTTGINNIVLNLYDLKDIDESCFNSIIRLKNYTCINSGDLIICNIPTKIEKQVIYQKKKKLLFESQNELTALNVFNI